VAGRSPTAGWRSGPTTRFRPDYCEAADPQSKGMVENLVGYAKSDLMVPLIGRLELASTPSSLVELRA